MIRLVLIIVIIVELLNQLRVGRAAHSDLSQLLRSAADLCTNADVSFELLGGPSVAGVVGPEPGRRHDAHHRLVSADAWLVTGRHTTLLNRYPNAEGVEEMNIGEGVSPSPVDWGIWGSVVSSPAGSGAKPRLQTPFQHFLSVTERFRWKENAILLLNMVTDKVEKILRWAFRGWSRNPLKYGPVIWEEVQQVAVNRKRWRHEMWPNDCSTRDEREMV